MSKPFDYDLIVIGAGSAGLGAAREGVRRHARTLLISDGRPGGDCTFTGCVPSKTLIESAQQGLRYADALERVRATVEEIAATEDPTALAAEGINVVLGRARFTGTGRIDVDGRVITGRRFVLATGSRPQVPSIPGLDQAPYLTNETVFDPSERPTSLIVLGGSAVGCELAQAAARLGSHVTVVETADRLLPNVDPEASAVLARVFNREGISVRTNAQVTKVHQIWPTEGVQLTFADGTTLSAERLLLAVGRTPDTDGLHLHTNGVRVGDDGAIVTDERLATTSRGVYAAGDVTNRLPFTHAAYDMGRTAAGNALGRRQRRYRTAATPWVIFTDPEIAHVGITEADAAPRHGRVAYLPMAEMDRARTAAQTAGFVKLVAARRWLLGNIGGGRVLGATIVASRAGEMIHEPALAIATRMFTGRLAATTHAYPTWSYGVQYAAAQFFMAAGGRRARPARSARADLGDHFGR